MSNTFPTPSMTRSTNSSTKRKRDKLRFGIVGAGAVAQSYLQAFEHCDEAKIVGVADFRIDAAERAAERMHCRSYDRTESMIEDCDLDAAIVCTPPVTHPDICIQLLENRIHVLCEKPFSIDEQGAHTMLDAAQNACVKLTMASKFRYAKDVIRAKSIVASGVLGDLVLFENVFAHRVDMASRWNSQRDISGGGVLIDNGTHSVDLMRYFLGPLAEVHALEGRRSHGLLVEETASLFVRSVSGVICSIDLSWSITKQRDSYLDIYGSRGALSIGWKKSSYLDFSHGKWVPFGRGYNKLQAFRSQIENFSRAIRDEEPLLITGEDAIASVKIIESAYKALRQNQWVPVFNSPDPTAIQGRAN
jgi:predicted dehydrogenase